jgi:SMI1 / KNR4 family (SUKH-1)
MRLASVLLVSSVFLCGCGNDESQGAEPRSDLERVFAAWDRTSSRHDLNPPASDEEIGRAEVKLGRKLPNSLRAIYRRGDGGGYLDGNLMIEPLASRESFSGLVRLTKDMRRQGLDIPPEVVVFANDGSDALYGLWLANSPSGTQTPVVELGEGGSGIALIATDLVRFLKARTAYYVMLAEAGDEPLDELGVPRELRRPAEELRDDTLYALRDWADPDLPDAHADPYEKPTPVALIRQAYGSNVSSK